MDLFQKSVLMSRKQDEKLVAKRWAEYQKFADKIDFIENVKEEKYQEAFLKDIFENCLGYILDSTNPNSFNLEREKKNEMDGKKADGVIYVDNKIVGIIELKGQDTKSLDRVEEQAFGYLVSHSFAKYVILSNFDELRFYINKKTAYIEFSLFRLTYDKFKILHLILSYESIRNDIPLKLRDKSLSFEEEISNKLYKDFSLFRTNLFENIVQNNDMDKALLLRLTQKLCDRIIFILFAEDRGFLNANTIREIREEFNNQKFTNYTLYDIYKFYFHAIDEGNKKLVISKYNGGLFSEDKVLDSLVIDDGVLDVQAQALSDYNFMSDISVNILGHIFEQSLTDLEELNAAVNNIEFNNKKSKRKKDGVFYTPEYITDYIVENTIGKLCRNKKEELFLSSIHVPKNPKKPTKKEKIQKLNLDEYRKWLLNLKILDPACGSGAFLNKTLDFLITEHRSIQKDLVTMGDLTAYYEIEKSILENNLYGVDINEDAIEIAKLSLWLRTATKGRELTSLADKIKCGNSLIDDVKVDKNAFVWEEEFKEVFDYGGFDIVVGNPPYGAKLSKEHQKFLKDEYAVSSTETALLFIKLGFDILNDQGKLGFIIPKSFSFSSNYKPIRQYVELSLTSLIDCKKVWKEVKLEQVMIVLEKGKDKENYKSGILKDQEIINLGDINKQTSSQFGFFLNGISNAELNIALFMRKGSIFLNDITTNQRGQGLQKLIEEEGELSVLGGADIGRYGVRSIKGKINKSDIDGEQSYIKENSVLVQNLVSHIENPLDHIKIIATIPNNREYVIIDTINQISVGDEYIKEYIWLLLNSKLINWYVYRFIYAKAIRTMHFDSPVTTRIPIKVINMQEQNILSQKAQKLIKLNQELNAIRDTFLLDLSLEKISKKIGKFEELDFNDFVKEFAKSKKMKFNDKLEERNFKQEWKKLFEQDKERALQVKEEIAKLNEDIDYSVYRIYGLSKEMISVVENKNI